MTARHRRLVESLRGCCGFSPVTRMWCGRDWRALLVPLLFAVTGEPQICRAEQPWPLWQHYRTHFLEASGRIVDHGTGDRTTSEGQAYGMFFALVVNDRASFDKMLRWTEDNLAGGDLTARLPAWHWGRSDGGGWKPLDGNSAADADLWLAYDCLEAGRLWKDDRLRTLGRVLADRIAHRETALVPGVGTVLLPGQHGFVSAGGSYLLNPSYTPPQVLARLRQELPEGPWQGVAQAWPLLVEAGTHAGFAMDWVSAGRVLKAAPRPQWPAEGKADAPAVGSYDAIRVYLWLGMADPETPGVRNARAMLTGMSGYLAENRMPPLEVDSSGKVLRREGPIGFSAAVEPFLRAVGRTKAAQVQMHRVEAGLDARTGLYGHDAAYYDQNLIMFATGWEEQRFRFDREGRLALQWKP